jgi:ligand-binding SRPBCC domain-containing protein
MASRITSVDRPDRFVDEQVAGPLASWRHEHRFEAIAGGTRMIDDWEHAAPFDVIGRIVDALVLERRMRLLLETRNEALARAAAGR